MKIEVSTDTRVEGTAEAIENVTSQVEAGLARYQERLTRVEVHLSDVNGPRGGADRRCVLEVRPASRQPVAVTHEAGTETDAVRGAIEKMGRLLETTFGKLEERKGNTSSSGLPT